VCRTEGAPRRLNCRGGENGIYEMRGAGQEKGEGEEVEVGTNGRPAEGK
jgi:hypothetical protein